MIVSGVAPATACKGLKAMLVSPDLKPHLDARDPDGSHLACVRSNLGYDVTLKKLALNSWHLLAIARAPGLLPCISDEALWHELMSERYTTPLLREWVPVLRKELERANCLQKARGFGCQAGTLELTPKGLDEGVQKAVAQGVLKLPGNGAAECSKVDLAQGLEGYLEEYGACLAEHVHGGMRPLHRPGVDPLTLPDLHRTPFEAQAHVIQAMSKVLDRQKSVWCVAEMGSGKTLLSMGAIHTNARGRPYKALVFCPGQLVDKWEREIKQTIPRAKVVQIKRCGDVLHLKNLVCDRPLWFIIARDRAKLGAQTRAAYQKRESFTLKSRRHLDPDNGLLRCPGCGGLLMDDKGLPLSPETLERKRMRCPLERKAMRKGEEKLVPCGEPLWTMTGKIRRFEPARYFHKKLRARGRRGKPWLDYLVVDEAHQEKSADTAQANAVGSLARAARKVVALTGTLIGGYAEHVRPLLYRLGACDRLLQEGLGWKSVMPFNEKYGRIETRVTERERDDDQGTSNRQSRGTSRSTTKCVKPGIVPTLFGNHLMGTCIMLGLGEVARELPDYQEDVVGVPLGDHLGPAYHEVEGPLMAAIREMVKKGDRRLLGTMLQTLLCYPDYPYGWGPVGYTTPEGFWIPVVEPENFDGYYTWPSNSINVPGEQIVWPKEQALLDLVAKEKAQGRQVWVYVQYTDKRDVLARLEGLLKKQGLKVGVLRSNVELAKREEWIAEHGPRCDVVLSHPKLVETGLDLFSKRPGGHNFTTLVFYETGYDLFTLRQAARRSWRIGQKLPCRVVYMYYTGTLQERAMALMGKKLSAAQALEGKFSSEGLAAMAGDESLEMALAKSLASKVDEPDARRAWSKVTSTGGPKPKSDAEILAIDDELAEAERLLQELVA